MKTKQIKDITQLSEKRYLAFFDLLGFSELVKAGKTHELRHVIDLVQHFSNLARGYGADPFFSQRNQKANRQKSVKSLFFSDSIVFVTDGGTLEDLDNHNHGARTVLTVPERSDSDPWCGHRWGFDFRSRL